MVLSVRVTAVLLFLQSAQLLIGMCERLWPGRSVFWDPPPRHAHSIKRGSSNRFRLSRTGWFCIDRVWLDCSTRSIHSTVLSSSSECMYLFSASSSSRFCVCAASLTYLCACFSLLFILIPPLCLYLLSMYWTFPFLSPALPVERFHLCLFLFFLFPLPIHRTYICLRLFFLLPLPLAYPELYSSSLCLSGVHLCISRLSPFAWFDLALV